MRTMKAVQDSLEILELYGPDKLAYHFIDRSLSNVKEAELVATVAPIVVAEADAMNIPNTEVIFPKLGALAVDRFRQYWSENGLWKQDLADVAHLNPQADYVELKPTNIGVLIGALFRQGIIPAHTIHECLDALVEGRVSFPHLSVMRAIVKHAGSKLCLPDDENNFKSVMFMRKLGRESPHTGLYVWGWNRDAAWLRSDIVLTLENWAMAEKERMERQKGKERKKPKL
ncbi:hypothetical protein BDQ17DRAFT_784881 [Cyathus striatus]|nr:hypothetical protein BDQ17DRAFT_784881 [Cyathus striatus]